MIPSSRPAPTRAAYGLLFAVAGVWGLTFPVLKDALQDASPLFLNALRMAVAAGALSLYYRRHFRRLTAHAASWGGAAGLLLYLVYTLQTQGLALTTASKSAFLTGAFVPLVPLVAFVLSGESLDRRTAAAVSTSMLGLYLLTVPHDTAVGPASLTELNKGDMLTLGCAVALALHMVLLGRALQTCAFEHIALVQWTTAAALAAATTPALEAPTIALSPRLIAAVLYTGVAAGAVAYSVQVWAQQYVSATHTALILALEPVFGWLAARLMLGERLRPLEAAGAVALLAGSLFVVGRGRSTTQGP